MLSLAELATSFGLGVAANLNPCVLPLYPGFLSYIAGKPEVTNKKRFTKLAGLIVLSGVMAFMIIIGAVTAALGLSIGTFVSTISPIAFGVMVVIGILLFLNVDFSRLYFFLPQTSVPKVANPYRGAFVFGFLFGPIVIPCNAPLVFAVFAYSVGVTGFAGQFTVLIAFGLGLGLPLVGLSLISAAKGQWLIHRLVDYHTLINRIAGLLLVLLGTYELIIVFRVFG